MTVGSSIQTVLEGAFSTDAKWIRIAFARVNLLYKFENVVDANIHRSEYLLDIKISEYERHPILEFLHWNTWT